MEIISSYALRIVVVLIALAVSLLAGPVCAADGTITFQGAIVAPTCAVTTVPVQTGFMVDSQQNCEADTNLSSYALSVQSVDEDPLPGDAVLAYYAAYIQAADGSSAGVRLLTQTYN